MAIEVHLSPLDLHRALEADVRRGLTTSPKELSPKWFYDERGSRLFEIITRLPEYYPTSREREILHARASEIAGLTRPHLLVELGAGTSTKTHILLDALVRTGELRQFTPFDVSEPTLRDAARALVASYPSLEIRALVGDFETQLSLVPRGTKKLVAFFGGTIGNFQPMARAKFLNQLFSQLEPGDALLLGTDLVKDVKRLEAAYNDSAGVTVEFNRNVLRVLNRELAANFDPSSFAHVARFDARNEWIEMWLRSDRQQRIDVAALGMWVEFAAGEEMRTEISAKFRREGVSSELAKAGFRMTQWWTDAGGDYALSLSFRGSRRND